MTDGHAKKSADFKLGVSLAGYSTDAVIGGIDAANGAIILVALALSRVVGTGKA